MSIYDQLPAQIQPVQPIDQMRNMAALKGLLQQNQMGDIQLQQAKQAQSDDQALRKAWRDSGGDFDKAYKLASQYGASPQAVQKLQQSQLQLQHMVNQKNKDELAIHDEQHYNFNNILKPVVDLINQKGKSSDYPESPDLAGQSGSMADLQRISQDPASLKKQSRWMAGMKQIAANPSLYGDPQQVQQLLSQYGNQYPGDDAVLELKADTAASHKAVQEANERLSHQTPDKMAMQSYIDQGMSAPEAYRHLQQDKNIGKPPPAGAAKQEFQGIMKKLAGEYDGALAAASTSPKRLAGLIEKSTALTQDEKQAAIGYMMANPTPASQALNVSLRGESYAQARAVQVLDTKNGNRPMVLNMNDINAANFREPGRYIPAGPGQSALSQTNLVEDIRGANQNLEAALTNPKLPDFPPAMRAKMLLALKDRDPYSAWQNLVGSEAIDQMTPEQQDLVVAMNQAVENAMALRSTLKMGQGGEDIRTAIRNTLPGILSPNKQFAMKQLRAFEAQINRISRGIPEVPLRPMPGQTQGSNKRQNAKPNSVVFSIGAWKRKNPHGDAAAAEALARQKGYEVIP